MREEKPQYQKHKDADWSGVYYGEALEKYFPKIPNINTKTSHWFFEFVTEKHNPVIDLYVFHIKKDLKNIKMESRAKFYKEKKLGVKIFIKRLFFIKTFQTYCSKEIKDFFVFLKLPAYEGICLT